jgi:RNA polymerase sigma factor (sigma-70 family)
VSLIEQDKLLVQAIAAGDKNAIEKLYKTHYSMVQSLVTNNNGSKDDAADVFQETIIVLYEKVKIGGFELQAQLKTYIYSVARRIWLNKLQKSQRYNSQPDDIEEIVPVEDDVEQQAQQQQNFTIMEAAMGKVGEPCKSLLQAFYLQKKTMDVISAEFGYTNAENAKNQKYKCLVRLKKLFFAQYKTEA